jgi:hypothetical protein
MDEEERLRLVGEVRQAIDGCWLGLFKEVRNARWDLAKRQVQSALQRMATNPPQPFQPPEDLRRPLNTLQVADIPALSCLPPVALQQALIALVPLMSPPVP